ncbi:MAG: esterase [Luteitalea sp.]|nr:esterase [Luteitalea sp.]
MRTDYQHWYSPRLQRDLGIAVFGHWGPPLLAFPTSGGNEWEHHDQGMVAALTDLIDAGRVKLFCVNSVHLESFANRGAHPFHRSWVQTQYDEYIRWEVVPFIRDHCRTDGLTIATMGASLGAYHAVNTLFKHPDVVKGCYGLSGVYDMARFMDGMYDTSFYFNNPLDYLSNLTDASYLEQLSSCEIRLVTGCGPWEDSRHSYELSRVLSSRGIHHHLDDWGPQGGHDWPYWKAQMREYIGRM